MAIVINGSGTIAGVSATGITTAPTNATDATKLPLAGGSITGNVNFGDNVKAQFGDANDLNIYHNGTHSIVQDSGSGDLKIWSSKVEIQSPDAGENIAIFNDDGDVQLYHNNALKLATTATGVNIIASTSRRLSTSTSGEDLVLTSFHQTNNRLREFQMAGYILKFFTGSNGSDTSTTEKMRITSDGKVGIGIDPHHMLHIKKNSTANSLGGGVLLQMTNEQGAGNFASLRFTGSNQNGYIGYRDGANDQDRRISIGIGADAEHISFSQAGIKFNGDTAAANGLDDYEEGTWTPTWSGANSSDATYTKIGRMVHCSGKFAATGSGTSGDCGGLPFTTAIDGSEGGASGYHAQDTETWSVLKISGTGFRFYQGGSQRQLTSSNETRFFLSYHV